MKLYEYPGAPNPRRVKIFAAEKGIDLELVECNLMTRDQKSPEFLAKNPSGKIPVLELDDGRCIPESVAICRYLEAIQPEPNLFGRDAFELGLIEARNRQIEFEFWREISISWINGPIVGSLGLGPQAPQAKEISDARTHEYYERLDREFTDNEFVAAGRFTVADISLLTGIDFASSLVGLPPDPKHRNLKRWHQTISARQSCMQHPATGASSQGG